MEPTNIAAIDIGSNGARLLIKRFDDEAPEFERIRKLMFVRVPLRLGKDVFTLGKISKERSRMMMHMMKGFHEFMRLYGVQTYRACATSAMRDAENGKKVMRKIEKETGIRLEIIPGAEEAGLLCNNLVENTDSAIGNYAYVDVGGGSTEISLLHDGVLAESHSFNIGTLRMLSGSVQEKEWHLMRHMLNDYAKAFPDTRIIGSGGNINRLYKLIGDKNAKKQIDVAQLRDIHARLSALTIEGRMEKYGLKEDRADVIIPAGEIFIAVADALGCDTILVPNISLADSIVDGLYRNMKKEEDGRESRRDDRV